MRTACTIFLVLFLALPGAAFADRDDLTQISTIDALMTGVYDGAATLGSLKEKGDFGIGTFNNLNGEMVLLDGVFYRITSTGAVELPGPETKTPFASVTFFDADRTALLGNGITFAQFAAKADNLLPTPNIFYAVKITGTFEIVRARSVAAQDKPYKPLLEVVKTQAVFEFTRVEGTIVGFRCPAYAKSINVPGYHLHFLSADRKMGGHVLDFKVIKAKLEIDDTNTLILMLPSDKEFYASDLTQDREQAVRAVEK